MIKNEILELIEAHRESTYSDPEFIQLSRDNMALLTEEAKSICSYPTPGLTLTEFYGCPVSVIGGDNTIQVGSFVKSPVGGHDD